MITTMASRRTRSAIPKLPGKELVIGYGVIIDHASLTSYLNKHYPESQDLRKSVTGITVRKIHGSNRYFIATHAHVINNEGDVWDYNPSIQDFLLLAKIANDIPVSLSKLPESKREEYQKKILEIQEIHYHRFNLPKVHILNVTAEEPSED